MCLGTIGERTEMKRQTDDREQRQRERYSTASAQAVNRTKVCEPDKESGRAREKDRVRKRCGRHKVD